jgi:urocanate hydratase
LRHTLDNDTGLGVLRYADAGYPEALDEVEKKGIRRVNITRDEKQRLERGSHNA